MESYSTSSPTQSDNCSLDLESPESQSAIISVQVYVCEYNIQKCWQFRLDDTVWSVKQTILASLSKDLREGFNYGLFLPPCNGRAGKFLLEERTLKDYPFHDCVPYFEFKYKRRVYKMMNIDEKIVKLLHQKSALKKFWDYVQDQCVDKIEKLCNQGFDPNFHGPSGETPLTFAVSIANNAGVIMTLIAGGAHLDFRSLDGQTALHKAAIFPNGEANVKTLLSLGASPNCRDSLNFTPLYRCVLSQKSCAQTAEILLRDYSEIGVVDVHGNQEIHQACKNGLSGHLEHLLFYGANLNSRNVNGNTPLHICAVNNQENCARILLFRGADPAVVNNQGQTAFHVANLIGNVKVVEVIKSHANKEIVPYRSQPRYNSKRRFTWSRRPSTASEYCGGVMRHSASSASCYAPTRPLHCGSPAYGSFSPGLRPALHGNQTLPNELHSATVQSLREALPHQLLAVNGTNPMIPAIVKPDFFACHDRIYDDANIPRILVIPRGKKGFGFILRGAKKLDSNLQFQPSPEIPALQYFEGIDTNGMAMKAGLKPGDFLLEINNVDVRRASHEQVVRLIQMASDTITLKVVTISPSNQVAYSPCATSNSNGSPSTRSECGRSIPNHRSPYQFVNSPVHHTVSYSTGRSMTALNDCNGAYNSPLNQRPSTSTSKSVDNLPSVLHDAPTTESVKVASVKQRSAHRRVSVVEIEHLMQRQGGGSDGTKSTASGAPGDATSFSTDGFSAAPASPGPRVYASVAEMKRQRRHGAKSSFACDSLQQNGHVLTLRVNSENCPPTMYQSGPVFPNFSNHLRRSSSEFDTVRYRSMSDLKIQVHPSEQYDDSRLKADNQSMPEHRLYSLGRHERRMSSSHSGGTKPPPPRPPIRSPSSNSLLISGSTPSKAARAPTAPPPPPSLNFSVSQSSGKDVLKGSTESAAQLSQLNFEPKSDAKSSSNQARKSDKSKPVQVASFELDLKSAIAKRRVCIDKVDRNVEDTSSAKISSTQPADKTKIVNSECLYTPIIRGSAASLKESVAKTISSNRTSKQRNKGDPRLLHPTSRTQEQPSSPTIYSSIRPLTNNINNSGSLMKKDSGYTSSRNSLVEQHAENVAEMGDAKPSGAFFCDSGEARREALVSDSDVFEAGGDFNQMDMLRQNRVSVLSQKIEDNINDLNLVISVEAPKKQIFKIPCNSSEHDSMSLTSTASSSMLSNASHSPKRLEIDSRGKVKLSAESFPEVPPPDYDLADSGNGDSDQEQTTVARVNCNVNFAEKPLHLWTVNDVGAWLDSMRMSEYKDIFLKVTVNGRKLLRCDRAEFTKLGVTRVAHRIAMENSLKRFMQDDRL